MKYKKVFLLVLCLILVLSGCKKSKPYSSAVTPTPEPTTNAVPTPAQQKYYAPYTGEEVSEEAASKPAFLAIIENYVAARPQSGFTSADIVFEAMTEGGITRCLALFQKDDCSKIGPIRSMRTYFIDIACEYGLPFAHCGGSHDALDRIKNEPLMSMNQFVNGSSYWRDPTIKVQEHSLYSSTENLISLAQSKGYAKKPSSSLKFDKSYWDNAAGGAANSIYIKFHASYNTSYEFKDGLYYKSMNKIPTLNKEDQKPVALKNIVIQNVKYRSRPNETYLDADLIGSGDGYIISNGRAVKITWSRASLTSQTIFKDEKGNIVPLNPGKTWWHLLDQNASLTIN
jgi:Protein of unknown function (DUF3048).